ncbi:hypothetical protein T439DRAFT_325312 [Meredithblackwellia eburnea MCA 4105]
MVSHSQSDPEPFLPAQLVPYEILIQIFTHISISTGSQHLNFTLTPKQAHSQRPAIRHAEIMRNLTLVCRNWSSPASELLFSNLTIGKPGQLPMLLKQSRRCLGMVRHLRVLWNRQPWILPQDPELALIPDLLDLCDKVDKITLAGEQFNLSSPSLLASLSRRSNPLSSHARITHFSCCSIETPFFHQRFGPQGRRTSETIGALLRCLPDLVEARFDEFRSAYSLNLGSGLGGGGGGRVDNDFSASGEDLVGGAGGTAGGMVNLAPNLRKIALQRVTLESANLERLLCPLSGQLTMLYLDRTSLSTCESFRMILRTVGASLEVLELKDCDIWATWETNPLSLPLIDEILLICPILHTFVLLGTLDSTVPTFPTPHSTLQHLTLGCRHVDPKIFARAVLERKFEGLKDVLVEATCEWTDEGEGEVMRACKEVGVGWETGWSLD